MLYFFQDRGSVLVSVLVVMLVLTILGTALISLSMADLAQAARQEKSIEAYYLARSGADAVAAHMLQHPEDIPYFLSQGEEEVVMANGKFNVCVVERDGEILIESTGYIDKQMKKVTLSLLPDSGPPLDMAVFALSSIELVNHAKIGSVGTNSTKTGSVRFCNDAKIIGDFYAGPGSNPNAVVSPYGGYPHISGSLKNLQEERSYPLPEFPSFPADLPYQEDCILWGKLTHYISADGEYRDINLSNDSHLIIDVGSGIRQIRIRRLSVANGAKITLVGTGKLILYVEQQFNLCNESAVNTGGDPNQVMLYYKGSSSVSPANDSHFFGSIYAESADLNLSNASSIRGSIITGGSMVTMSNSSTADVRVVYAPKAQVIMANHAEVTGSIVCKSFLAANHVTVNFAPVSWGDIPFSGKNSGLKRGHWK